MRPFLRFDEREFRRAARELQRVSLRSSRSIIKQQAKLLVRDLLKMTPPFGKHPIKESFNAQRKIGRKAVAREIGKVFRPLTALFSEHSMTDALKRKILGLARRGMTAVIEKLLKDESIPVERVLIDPDPKLHDKARGRDGRVRRGHRNYVLRVNSLKQYIREKLNHVGKLKSGWKRAAAHFKVGVPAWIKQHNEPGMVKDKTNNRDNPTVTVGNLTPFGRKTEARIVEAALQKRVRSMMIQAQKIMRAEADKRKGR